MCPQYCGQVMRLHYHFQNANFNEQSLACKNNFLKSIPAGFVHVLWKVMSIRNFIETKVFKLAQWNHATIKKSARVTIQCIMMLKSSMLSYKFYTLCVLDQNLACLYQTWQLRQVQGACFGVNKCNNWMHGVLSHIWHTQLYNNFIPGYIIYQWYMQTILWRLEHL